MDSFLVAEDIIPLAQFKAHASECLNKLKKNKRSIIITQNGKAAGVLIPPEEYDRLRQSAIFIASVEQGLQQSNAGSVISHDLLAAEIALRYGSKE